MKNSNHAPSSPTSRLNKTASKLFPLVTRLLQQLLTFKGVVILLLSVIVLLILRPRITIYERPVVEEFACTKKESVKNPKYEEEQKRWIAECLTRERGYFAESSCGVKAIGAKYENEMFVKVDKPSVCERQIATTKNVYLKLFSQDKVTIKIISYKSYQQ